MDLYGGDPQTIDNRSIIAFDYGPNGGSPAIVYRDGDMSVLEFPVGTEVLRYDHIGPVRISPDGGHICFIAGPYNRLMIAELGGPVTTLLNDLGRSTSCAWSPNGVEILYTSGPRPGAIYHNIEAIRPDGNDRRILEAYTSYVRIADVAADGAILISAGETRFASKAGSVTDGLARDISVFDASRVASLNGAGTHVLIYDNSIGSGGDTLFVRPIAGSGYRQLATAPQLALSNDARTVAVSSDGSGAPRPDLIRLIDVETNETQVVQLDFELGFQGNLLGMNVWANQIAEFSDDNRRLLFPYASANGERHRVYVYDFEQQESYAVAPAGVTGPVILSPDGQHVASNEESGLWIYEVETGERRLAGNSDPGMLARWSYDDNVVFLIEQNGAGATIVERNVTTGVRREIREVRAADEAGVTLFDLRLARDGEN